MVIDTSAIVAIMFNASSAPRLIAAIEQSPVRMIAAGTVTETSLVVLGRYALAVARDQDLLFVGEDFAQTDVSLAAWYRPYTPRWH